MNTWGDRTTPSVVDFRYTVATVIVNRPPKIPGRHQPQEHGLLVRRSWSRRPFDEVGSELKDNPVHRPKERHQQQLPLSRNDGEELHAEQMTP